MSALKIFFDETKRYTTPFLLTSRENATQLTIIREQAITELTKLESEYTAAIKENTEVGKLNADLQEENEKLKRKLEQAQKIAIYYSDLPHGVRPSLYSLNLIRNYKKAVE